MMKLFTTIVITIFISMVFDQIPITTEARQLKKTNGQDHSKTGFKDRFVPTSPGNIPSIGHKKGNANVEGFQSHLKPKEGRTTQKTNGKDHFKTGSMDEFAPTTPGNSPGIGHKKAEVTFKDVKVDFKLTEDRQSHEMNRQDHFITGSTDDFAPTFPGNSPGMGHKKGDEFKPTTPGHSPGVGHAIKNDEPKA